MEVVLERLNPRAQAVLGVISSIIGIFICCILVWYGVMVTYEQWLSGAYRYTNLETPNYIVLIIIPIGSLLFLIQFIRRAHKYIGELRIPAEPEQQEDVEYTKQA
jgi:TRAP-type C4-dicarboxylate transport system permease small subunit